MKSFQFLYTVGGLSLVGAHTLPLRVRSSDATSRITATEFGSVFDAPVTIGGQTFQMLVDTGSSDTYVMRDGFTCINPKTNLTVSQTECQYANHTYHESSTYREIPGEIFGIQYGAGIASGVMAYEDVAINGITLKNQKVAIANVSHPMGDGVNSGLLGLAYPSITSAHPEDKNDNTTFYYNRLPYDPLLFSAWKQGLTDSYFSIALARTPRNTSIGFGGYLTIGGLPPVKHSSQFAVVPVEIIDVVPLSFTSGKRVRSYWATTFGATFYGSSGKSLESNTTSFQGFFDIGNELSYVPQEVADAVNSRFSPPAVFDSKLKAYRVNCAAKPAHFGLKIGNQTFFHEPEDLIYKTGDGCVSAVSSSQNVAVEGITIQIIGASFLKSILSVYDVGKNEMRFAKLYDVPKQGGNGTVPSLPPSSSGFPSSSPSPSSSTPPLSNAGSLMTSNGLLSLFAVLGFAFHGEF
ncbi:pepsin-like aspartic protease [Aspergillus affinis]|uniref:pepsin-like aspartic protease n=1 Tax=Aspergillus affinis TaxID=1070780 RepID=UPI0022FE5178|nr:acid protease [Aspergillus affinis]KAI9039312.1 acid protease [Aspergillus affinis]